MKKIFLLATLILSFVIGKSQTTYPINQYIGAPSTLVTAKGGFKADSSLILPVFSDTAKANISTFIKNYAGTLIRVGDSIYVRSKNVSRWILVGANGGGGSQNLQQVTDIGDTTTNDMFANSIYYKDDSAPGYGRLRVIDHSWIFTDRDGVSRAVIGEGGIALKNITNGNLFSINGTNLTTNKFFEMPNYIGAPAYRTIPMSVNGTFANTDGSIILDTTSLNNKWSLFGNSNAIAGTNFLGTTNNIPLEFRIKNVKSGIIDSTNKNVGLGFNALKLNTPNGASIGTYNVAIGHNALSKDTFGIQNVAIGGGVMGTLTTSARGNVGIGYATLNQSKTPSYDVAVGWGSLARDYFGSYNTAIGSNISNMIPPAAGDTMKYNTFIGASSAAYQKAGRNNVFVGDSTGALNQNGSRNILIGSKAGLNETGSDKLYIANSSTSNPLIFGNFADSTLKVNGKLSISTISQLPDSSLDVTGGIHLRSIYSSNNAADSMMVIKSNGGVGYRSIPSSSGGSVTSVSQGYGIVNTPNPIVTTGTIIADTTTAGLSGKYLRIIDTANTWVNNVTKLNDTTIVVSKGGVNTNIVLPPSPVYTQSPIMSTVSNDSNIIYFNADTAAAWRGGSTSTVYVDSIYRTVGKDSIYYKKNGNTYAIKDSVGTNPAPVGYYGAFQDTITQNIPTANTAYPIKARITDLSNGVVLKDSTRFLFNNTGIYNLQWSGQFQNTDNAIQDVRVWVRKNNVDIIGTTGLVSIPARKNTSDYGHTVAGWNFLLDMVAGDSLQFYWSATSSSISLQYYPLGTIPPSPTTASMVVTITQQSGIMAGTGITAINSLTGAAQTMVTGTDSSDFKIVSTGTTHKFNLPTASATKRGALSSTDWSTFNGKIGASDTSVFQRKSISSYSIMANNTNAAANTTAMTFRDVAEANYTGTIVWTGSTAPTSVTSRYRWTQIGNMVNFYFEFTGTGAGTSITAVTFDFPTDMPTPTVPSGLSGASVYIYKNMGLAATTTTNVASVGAYGGIRRNAGNTAFEFNYSGYNTNIRTFQTTGTYYTN